MSEDPGGGGTPNPNEQNDAHVGVDVDVGELAIRANASQMAAVELAQMTRNLQLPKLDHDTTKFQDWTIKFKSFSAGKGMLMALTKSKYLPKSEFDDLSSENVDDVMKMERARVANRSCMAYLMQAMVTDSDMSIVFASITDEWPGGLAYLVYEALEKKYQPKDTLTKVEAYQKLTGVTMTMYEDPKTMFEQIATIQNWHDTPSDKLDKSILMTTVLKNCPQAYKPLLANQHLMLKDKLTLEDMRFAMDLQYRTTYKEKNEEMKEADKNGETSLCNVNGGDMSNVECFYCNEKGHVSRNCPEKMHSDQKCGTCGRTGHEAESCWSDEKNKDKRPQWLQMKMDWKAKQQAEVQNVQVDVDGYEIALVAARIDAPIKFGDVSAEQKFEFGEVSAEHVIDEKSVEYEKLEDPEIFSVEEAAATMHNSKSKVGQMNERPKTVKRKLSKGRVIESRTVNDLSVNVKETSEDDSVESDDESAMPELIARQYDYDDSSTSSDESDEYEIEDGVQCVAVSDASMQYAAFNVISANQLSTREFKMVSSDESIAFDMFEKYLAKGVFEEQTKIFCSDEIDLMAIV